MFRRSILGLSSRQSGRRILVTSSQTIPSYLFLRKEFSSSPQNPNVGLSGKKPESKSSLPKFVLGTAVVAGAALFTYQSGYLDKYLDKYLGKEQQNSGKIGIDHKDVKETQHLEEQVPVAVNVEPGKFSDEVEQNSQQVESQIDLPQVEAQQKTETHIDFPQVETKQKPETHGSLPHVQADDRVEAHADVHRQEALSETQGQKHPYTEEKSAKEDALIAVQEKQEPEFSQSSNTEYSVVVENSESKSTSETTEGVRATQVQTQLRVAPEENQMKTVPSHTLATEDRLEASLGKGSEVANLLDTYHLKDRAEGSTINEASGEEALVSAMEELNDSFITKDGKLIMSFLQAIHAAEKRQAEIDARAFAEEKRAMKEKFEKELRDLRARELMCAEEAALLDKELKREKAKAAAAIRAVQEKMEEKLRMELEQKENEAKMNLKKFQDLAKAELAAAIANEKAAQLEKIVEADLHINALCMAFYARSEEARQIHSVHKLALGALALEDALSKGLPIQQEIVALNTYLEGVDKDSLVHLVISTLPEETRYQGTDTLLQLNQKFNALKGTLRHYILIPPGGGGGGLLAHAMAQIASWLRFKEVDPSGDGIESIISRVEIFLAEGKLAEAADALQEGVRGSQAEVMADDWVRRARNRAITEQALTVLQSYAACISLTQ
ncbi:MICOS complex subunit MIC60 [Jatropha curcas]|uniref:MICOS complex subunit MIC60 n=1 Tax=Jatropha curcas TaxID=180498 RepID=UPI0005FB68AB|nr:MICOS complex subunit MIC60 [Jatropha curcas]